MTDFRVPRLNAGERLYRACLYLYPANFRRAFARDCVETFRDARRGAARDGRTAAFWIETLHDVMAQGLTERCAAAVRALMDRRCNEESVMKNLLNALRVSELRHAVRRLGRTRAFVAATIMVLALGIGATTAAFSVVNGILLRPLSYPEPDRLVELTHTAQVDGVTSVDQSAAGLLYYQEHARELAASGGWQDRDVNVSRPPENPGPAERISGALTTANLFDVLGVRPAIGRSFRAGEDRPGATPVVILSNRLWRRLFHSDPAAVGKLIEIDGVQRQIVGIMPRGFTFIRSAPELWYPVTLDRATASISDFPFRSVARLRAGETIESARTDLAGILPRIVDEFPSGVPPAMWQRAHVQPVLTPLRDYVVGDVWRLLWILLGSVSLVLVIACANVASLLIVRAESRQLELAVRGALGSGLAGLMATTLSESLVLGAAGGILGITAAEFAVRWANAYAANLPIPRLEQISVDYRVFAFGVGLAGLCALVVGAIPMLRARRIPIAIVLREAGRAGTGHGTRQHTRNALVVAQVALGLVLVTASALFARSFMQLRHVEPGFRSDGIVTARLVLPTTTYPTRRSVALMERRLLEAVRAVPGIHAASLTDWVPLTDDQNSAVIAVEDHPAAPGVVPGVRPVMTVDGSYFTTMGIPLFAGRTFEPLDPEHRSHEAVVTHAFTERFWPGGSALGKRIRLGLSGAWFTIVGEAADAHYDALDKPMSESVYLPFAAADSDTQMGVPRHVALVVDAGTDAPNVAAAIRQAVRTLDPELPTFDERSLTTIVFGATARARVTLILLVLASALALGLGGVGMYGVMSYTVTLRQREIGVRIALGAQPSEVYLMIARQGLRLGLAGVGIGLVSALAVTRVLRGLLFGISPTDPLTLGGTCVVLIAITFVASLVPARRAASIDPADALRRA
jgi:putative ABC transport system permease protein